MKAIELLSLCRFTCRYFIWVYIPHWIRKWVSGPPTTLTPTLDRQWLTVQFQQLQLLSETEYIIHCEASTSKLTGGYLGNLQRFHLHYSCPKRTTLPTSVVLKTTAQGLFPHFSSFGSGVPREALFYQHIHDIGYVPKVLPVIYYACGTMDTGESVILMEDFVDSEWVACSKLTGNQCWGKPTINSSIPVTDGIGARAIQHAFQEIALFHAKHWRNTKYLTLYPWLNASQWVQGQDQPGYEQCINSTRRLWSLIKENMANNPNYGVKWSSLVIETMDRSIQCTSWDIYQELFNIKKNRPFTLCHGDFHGANILLCPSKREQLCFLDWAAVGISDGASDLSQYLISNATIDDRRKNEMAWVKDYWEVLVANGVSSSEYPFDECWQHYQHGGIERWLQMLAIMAGIHIRFKALPPTAVQWFHDQVLAFLEDHADQNKAYPLLSGYYIAI